MYRARLIEYALNQNRGEEIANLVAAVQHPELSAHLNKLMVNEDINTDVDSECSDNASVVSFGNMEDECEDDEAWAQVDDPSEGLLELTYELCHEEDKIPYADDDFNLDEGDTDVESENSPETSRPNRRERAGCGECGCTQLSTTVGCCVVCRVLFKCSCYSCGFAAGRQVDNHVKEKITDDLTRERVDALQGTKRERYVYVQERLANSITKEFRSANGNVRFNYAYRVGRYVRILLFVTNHYLSCTLICIVVCIAL